jgi:hypothetical protein
MSAMIKAISRQIDTLPCSRTTVVVVTLWAATFAAFTVLGLRF